MTNLYISGYRTYELGVFSVKDAKVDVIKKALKQEITSFIENGVDWILTSGQLGVEQWAVEVVEELKIDYPEVQQAIIFPFLEFGSNWKDENKLKLVELQELADYTESTSHQPYKDPSQLKNHQQFLLEHSNAALLVYDREFEGKTKFLYEAIQKKQENSSYECRLIDFDQLQNTIENETE
ncbi:DUF1273 domain-containing protein [Desemzia sp. RIT804]|uniref:DUF1273 domain-containing protein n=1 Tax=Desemzia sp. RIT 804 TaxID=2810209 RepID=UPI00195101E8|nr:DUF1273 domain-containing protein [Desemzia sp. RIT 804]MBM6613740.1 DUF1273 domain-containing protein [Desemzia sp. RIT 804]